MKCNILFVNASKDDFMKSYQKRPLKLNFPVNTS